MNYFLTMNESANPAAYYEQTLARIRDTYQHLLKRKQVYGLLRLAIALAVIAVAWTAWPSAALASPFIFIFLVVLRADLKNRDAITHQERLRDICETELRCLDHQYLRQETGLAFADEHHPYAEDLDIFGKASLYQYVNRAASEQGKQLLSQWMKTAADASMIVSRQKAVQELSHMTPWRQEFQAHGAGSAIKISTGEIIRKWISEESRFIGKPLWMMARFIIPGLALLWLGMFLFEMVSLPAFLFGLTIFIIGAFWISSLVYPAYRELNRISPELETLAMGIGSVETASWKDPLLKSIQERCYHGSAKASVRIHRLRGILDRFDYRMNPLVYVPLNTFFLWDLQLVLQLERWKQDNRQDSGHWFEALAEMEALSSLGTLAFNHPHWAYPVLHTPGPECMATKLAHPLIDPARSVSNDFSTVGPAQLTLVTGSNMAGKSTFLRSVGVNMVLAFMGAPVCAGSMRLSPCQLMTSMRIKDNLEESTSTFYAELKKLKSIIDAVNAHEPVFILLDEILRGTNSHDRQTGALALVKQFIRQQASGIIATHDLELATLEKEYPGSLHNYHFDVQVTGTEMYFDYTLKPGICQSMNASLLMQKIGIEITG
jgi:hypothetical protein